MSGSKRVVLDGRRCSKTFVGILLFPRPTGQMFVKIMSVIRVGENTSAKFEMFAFLSICQSSLRFLLT